MRELSLAKPCGLLFKNDRGTSSDFFKEINNLDGILSNMIGGKSELPFSKAMVEESIKSILKSFYEDYDALASELISKGIPGPNPIPDNFQQKYNKAYAEITKLINNINTKLDAYGKDRLDIDLERDSSLGFHHKH